VAVFRSCWACVVVTFADSILFSTEVTDGLSDVAGVGVDCVVLGDGDCSGDGVDTGAVEVEGEELGLGSGVEVCEGEGVGSGL